MTIILGIIFAVIIYSIISSAQRDHERARQYRETDRLLREAIIMASMDSIENGKRDAMKRI